MNDTTLKQLVIDELKFEPSIDASDIGVAVENGIVTLSGHVSSFAHKAKVEEIVIRVRGVKGFAEEIEVRYPGEKSTADDVLARRAVDQIHWNAFIPDEAIKVKVQKGHVTLAGEVQWQYQKDRAYQAIREMDGITGITNSVKVAPRATATDVKNRIENALKRSAELEADDIKVTVMDGKVNLEGKVKAWPDRGIAERAAWSAPGVRQVEDHLRVA